MFTVYNVGMIYFDNCRKNGTKRVLVPDGRDGDPATHTVRHYASLFVGADKVDLEKTHWWWGAVFQRELTFLPEMKQEENGTGTRHGNGHSPKRAEDRATVKMYEFRINAPSDVSFPDKRNGGAEYVDFKKLPKFEKGFELAAEPHTIARITLRGGTLEPRSLMDVPVVCWTVTDHADPIRITARDDEGNLYCVCLKDMKTLEQQGAKGIENIEMVFSNTPDFIALTEGAFHCDDCKLHATGHRQNGQSDHDVIYSKLLKQPAKLVDTGQELTGLRFKRGYLDFLANSDRYKQGHCTPTCCAP